MKQLGKTSETIVFIGGGNMASSLIAGLVADGYDPHHILVADPDSEKLAGLAARLGIRPADSSLDAAQRADILVLAVKPQVLPQVCRELADVVARKQPLVISVAAGIREQSLRGWLGEGTTLVRSMPNTPAMVQTAATVLHAGPGVSDAQRDQAESVLRAVGMTQWVEDEDLMDTVTALSGSGPAYFFYIMEVLEEAACELGLPASTAHNLTLQTALGAARMAMESSEGPAQLRARVTSPGGTTERALETLEKGGLKALFKQALNDARERSRELSRMLGD